MPCIALHSAYNTALTLLANAPAGADGDADAATSGGIWLAALALAAVGVLYLVRTFAAHDRDPGA